MHLTRAEKIRLGTFVFTGLALVTGALLTLAGLRAFEKRDRYRVRFSESVGGLEVSAQVKYQGLRVGRVEALRVAPDNSTQIEVVLSLEPETRLLEGTTAVMDANPLTGLKTINLTPGDPRANAIRPGSELPVGKSLFDRLTGQAEAITLKVEQVANQLAHWTSDENRIRLERALESLARLIEHADSIAVAVEPSLVRALDQFDKTGHRVGLAADAMTLTLNETRPDLVAGLASLRGSLKETHRILSAIDDKKLKEAVAAFTSALKRFEERLSSAELGQAISRLSVSMTELAKLLEGMDLAVRSGREDFVMSLRAIRQASEDLREFSRIIAQDPSILLRGKEVTE